MDPPDLDSALKLLEDAQQIDGITPNVFMYSAVIWTAEKSGESECAMDLLMTMKKKGCTPNIVAYDGGEFPIRYVDHYIFSVFGCMHLTELCLLSDFRAKCPRKINASLPIIRNVTKGENSAYCTDISKNSASYSKKLLLYRRHCRLS
jgi:pentatricopeptide repeat protein